MNKDYMEDSRGRQVPVECIKEIDKLRDQTVKLIMERTFEMKKKLEAFQKETWDDIQEFLKISSEQHGVHWGGRKGNITLTSYDGKRKILIAVSDLIQFNEKLQIAKQLMDECMNDWLSDAKPELGVIVKDAFAVDKQGNVSVSRVLSLRQYNFKHPKWQKAIQIINESIQVVSSKTYMRFYERKNDGKYKQISLDVSAL